jgi:phage tail-like protein
MATILNNRSTIATDPIRNFRFLVRFIPQDQSQDWAKKLKDISFGFTSVTGMAVTTDSIPYREGGYNTTVHQIPGQSSFAPLQLQRGVQIGTRQNWDWMQQLFQTVQGTTVRGSASNFRCDVIIDVLSHPVASIATGAGSTNGVTATVGTIGQGSQDDHVSMRFRVYNAWITSLAYSDLSAGDNAILVEQMSLVHEGWTSSWATSMNEADTAEEIKY